MEILRNKQHRLKRKEKQLKEQWEFLGFAHLCAARTKVSPQAPPSRRSCNQLPSTKLALERTRPQGQKEDGSFSQKRRTNLPIKRAEGRTLLAAQKEVPWSQSSRHGTQMSKLFPSPCGSNNEKCGKITPIKQRRKLRDLNRKIWSGRREGKQMTITEEKRADGPVDCAKNGIKRK